MPTVDERLCHVTLKVKRAKEHVSDLEREIRAFFGTNPYRVGTKHDPETRKLIYYVANVECAPKSLPLIAGDVIQNLISALDHLAYQLVCSDTGDNPPAPTRIYFPIADSPEEYETRKDGKIKGASPATIDAIDALKPYKGGNDDLWVLYRLNNIEKHRLLLTVGSHAGGVNLAQYGMKNLPEDTPDWVKRINEAMPIRDIFYKEAGACGFPLEPGYELFIAGVDEKPDPDQQFRFDVAIDEPGIIQSASLLKTLHQATTLVEGIVTALTPRLKITA